MKDHCQELLIFNRPDYWFFKIKLAINSAVCIMGYSMSTQVPSGIHSLRYASNFLNFKIKKKVYCENKNRNTIINDGTADDVWMNMNCFLPRLISFSVGHNVPGSMPDLVPYLPNICRLNFRDLKNSCNLLYVLYIFLSLELKGD